MIIHIKYVKSALTRGLRVHDCGDPGEVSILPSSNPDLYVTHSTATRLSTRKRITAMKHFIVTCIV